MTAFFITGTDTGVGKTHISAGLSAFLSVRKHLSVGVMKPFESGLVRRDKDDLPWDAICLKEASGSTDDLDMISPYTFEAPLAPEVAAKMDDITIELDIVDKIYRNIVKRHDAVVVEGAGGVLVPITPNFFYIDLMKRWDVSVVVVSRLGLGTINHTLLTCNYILTHGVKLTGVILNDTGGLGDLASRTNPEVLKRYLPVPILGIFPNRSGLLQGRIKRELLADIFAENIDTGLLLERSS